MDYLDISVTREVIKCKTIFKNVESVVTKNGKDVW